MMIYVFILKKRKENRGSALGNKSLCDVGVRRDSEREVLQTHPPPPIPLANPIRWSEPNVAPLTYSFFYQLLLDFYL